MNILNKDTNKSYILLKVYMINLLNGAGNEA